MRISPLNSFNSMQDSDPVGLVKWLAPRLNAFDLAYLHVMRSDLFQIQKGDVLGPIRELYHGVLISNIGYTPEEAAEAVSSGQVDAVAFGTSFLANPDLPTRILKKAALNTPNPDTFYSPGAEGYTDYPFLKTP